MDSTIAWASKNVNRRLPYVEAIRRIQSHGIAVIASFIVGTPGENLEALKRIGGLVEEAQPVGLMLNIFTPLPGTVAAKEQFDAGRIVSHEWSLYDARHAVCHPVTMTPRQLEVAFDDLNRRAFEWRAMRDRFETFVRGQRRSNGRRIEVRTMAKAAPVFARLAQKAALTRDPGRVAFVGRMWGLAVRGEASFGRAMALAVQGLDWHDYAEGLALRHHPAPETLWVDEAILESDSPDGPLVHFPIGFLTEIQGMRGFLEGITASPGVHAPPTPEDSASFVGHFERLWRIAGMDASLGLNRATPDQRTFRDVLGPLLFSSEHLAYCLGKPRGYAGDFQMMEHICDRRPLSTDPLGRWLEAWFFDQFPPYVSVRNRVSMLSDILHSERRRGARRVLNMACGAAPELRPFFASERFEHVDLIDQDAGALDHAARRLAEVGGTDTGDGVGLHRFGVYQLLKDDSLLPEPYDVAYAMGLYDYLDQRTARSLSRALWARIAPGGLLVLGNYSGHHWARYVMEAVMDWFLVYRDTEDFRDIASALPNVADVQIDRDKTGLLQLLRVRKAPALPNQPSHSAVERP